MMIIISGDDVSNNRIKGAGCSFGFMRRLIANLGVVCAGYLLWVVRECR